MSSTKQQQALLASFHSRKCCHALSHLDEASQLINQFIQAVKKEPEKIEES